MSSIETVGTAEMARILRASPDKLRAMVKSGDVPYIPIGRKYSFVPENVIAALERKAEAARRTGRSSRSRGARRKVH